MNLTRNFTLEEFTQSETAIRLGIDNTPAPGIFSKLIRLAEKMEEIRAVALNDKPIRVSSAYRSLELNRAIKSKDTSQHIQGEAVDFTSPKFGTPREIVEAIIAAGIEFDQLILEFDSWVHVSIKESGNRGQVLIIDKSGTRLFS